MGDDCFFCGCTGSTGATPSVQDAGPTEPEGEAEVEGEQKAPDGVSEAESSPPSHLVPIRPPVTVQGELQALIAGENGCYAVTARAGYFDVDTGSAVPQAVVLRHVGDNGVVGAALPLPEASRRSYGVGTRLSEDIALPYASTLAPTWPDQDGTAHGVIVLDSAGAVLADHDLAARGLVYPSAVLEEGAGFVVIGSAGATSNPGNRIAFNAAAALRVLDRRDVDSVSVARAYNGFRNGGAGAIVGGQVLISAPDNSFALESDARSTLLVVDQETLALTEGGVRDGALVRGVGLNGRASVQDGRVLFTGAAADLSGRAINLVDATTLEVTAIQLPDEIATTDVPGGEFAGRQPTFVQGRFLTGGAVLLNLQQPATGSSVPTVMESRTYFYNPDGGSFDLLNATRSDFPIPPAEYGEGLYCTGESGTGVDEDGNKQSEVRFWSAE